MKTESNFFIVGTKVFIGLLTILAILCLVGSVKNPMLALFAVFCIILAGEMATNK